jgi:hypothetical protein
VPSTSDYVQLAMEETPRYENAVSATTPYRISTNTVYLPIQSMRVEPNPAFLDRSDELRSVEGGIAQVVDVFNPQGSLAIRAYPDILPWLLNSAGFTGVATAGDGSAVKDPDTVPVPVGATRWVFNKRTGINAKSFQATLAYFSEGVYLRGQGFAPSRLSMAADGSVTADLLGLVCSRITDPSLTASLLAVALPPFRRGDITLTWLTGSAASDDFSWEIANTLVQRHTFGLATPSYFPDALEQGNDRVRITGTIPKTSLDADDYDALINATTFSARAKYLSPKVIGATSYKYAMWIEMPACQYLAGTPDELTNARRRGASFNWWATVDQAAGYDVKITLVNAVAAIETYV